MTVDVKFGKLIETEEGPWCDFPGIDKEDDGTSSEFTIFSGKPLRSFATHGFYEWMSEVPEAKTFITAAQRPPHNDFHAAALDDTIMYLIDCLPEQGDPLHVDRAKWFKYWSNRAREEFGEAAIIAFS